MQSSEISEIGVSRRVRFRSFLQVPPFLHAVIFTLFRTRSAFAWESSPALTVQLQPNPVPKWEGVVKDWFDHLPFATAAFRPGWVRVVLSIGHPRLRSTAVLAGSGSVPTMAMPLRNISHAQVWVRVPNAPSGDKYEM